MKKRIFFMAVVLAGGALLAFSQIGSKPGADGESDAAAAVSGAGVASAAEASGATRTGGRAAANVRSEAELLLDQGLSLLGSGSTAQAQAAFLDVARRFPSHPAGVRAAVEAAAIQRSAGDLASARNILSAALKNAGEGPARQRVVGDVNIINGELIFSKKPGGGSIEYVVKRGDNLHNIGRQYKIPSEFIQRINYLTSDRINIGDRFKVFQGPFDVVIEKEKYRLTVYLNGTYVKEYRVGLGAGDSTPVGEFTVQNKLVDPVWNPPGPEYAASGAPDNPLGTRWIGFKGEYGIHGTIEPHTIGTQESRGCVRLLNSDVEEVYDMLVLGSKVTILP